MTEKQAYQTRVFNRAIEAGLNNNQAKIITAQATHESGNFKSNVFNTDNNIFGMKYPSVRSRQYIDGKSSIVMMKEGTTPYAHYNSLERSVDDLILGWHKYNGTKWSNIDTPEQYAAYLKRKGYYGDTQSNYTKSITAIERTLDFLKNNSGLISFTSIIIIIAIAVFLQQSK